MTQILIVDDHPIMREMLREFIGKEADLIVCGEAGSAAAALEALARCEPDLALIDVALPGASGIELARKVRERYPGVTVLMLSGHGEQSYVDRALTTGALGYVLKGDADQVLVAIREVMQGKQYLSPTLRPHG